jgi:hypothetical protein
MKLNELTQEQQAKLVEFRAEVFAQATSTEPADRARAEAAARRMAEIGGVAVNRVVWVSTPEQGRVAVDAAWASLRASLSASLSDSLWDSLKASLGDRFWASLGDRFWASLGDRFWASLGARICPRFWDSLGDRFWDSLRDSLSNSIWDSPWQAFYTFPALHMGVEYPPDALEKLNLHREIGASCFALWLVPGTVILCDRPEAVEIVDGKLISLTWRGQSGRVSK